MSSKYADEGTIAHALAAMCLETGKPASAYIGRLIKSEDYEHASRSPSGAYRWMTCPGSHALETRIAFKPRKFSLQVTEEMAEGVQIYLNNLQKYLVGLGHGNAHAMVERKLPVGHITGEEGATGSGDYVVLDFGAAEIQVHDLKFGKGVEVSAHKNPQLALYLLGAFEVFADGPDWQTFRGVIHQPRIKSEPDEYVWTREELLAFAEEAKEAAHLADDIKKAVGLEPNAAAFLKDSKYLVPGEKQCQFCDARPTCPAVEKRALETVVAEFVNLDALPAKVEQHQLTPIPADSARLGRLIALVPLIEGWASHIKAHAEAEMLAGRPVPGLKLVQGKRGNRAWRSDEEAETTFKSMRVKHDEMYDYNVISPTVAEKRFKKHPKQWKRLLELITQSDGKPTVVPEDDKRPALTVTPIADQFSVLPNEVPEEELV